MTDTLDRLKAALANRYRVEREFARGGMATVYLAEDLKHHRQVAIKVLSPDLGAVMGPDRFLREIDIAARLQHPHILPLLDSGEADGLLFYVMPFVEEQSLRARLVKEGELPIADAVRILRDVVDALTEAHAHGVVHRDIKPENILLRGRHSLVTDFGVSKAVSEATGRAQLTTAGVALGTPAYMAPEQASADPHLDHRVDIYAVGAVAYEVLTGRPVFMGTTPQMVLSAHMTEAPQPVSRHRETVPAALEAVVMRCLEKKPADRFQSAETLLAQLEALATPSGGLTPTDTRPLAKSNGLRRLLFPVAGAALLVVVAVVLIGVLSPEPFAITTSNSMQVTKDLAIDFQPVISPDGDEVAYVTRDSAGVHRIVVRSTIDGASGGQTRPDWGIDREQLYPAWTTNGARLRFWESRSWRTAGAWREGDKHGGSARAVGAGATDRAAWSPDETRIAFFSGNTMFARSVDGGAIDTLGIHSAGTPNSHSLAWSPDGRFIAYVNGNSYWRNWANRAPSSIWILDASGGEPVRVTDETTMNVSPQWLDSRHLLFISDREGARGVYVVEVGREGALGSPQSVPGIPDPHSISVSADGRRLAWAKFRWKQNIWSVPIPASDPVSIQDADPVTQENQTIEDHDVSRDGKWITYDLASRGRYHEIWKKPLRGGPATFVTRTAAGDALGPKFSWDGTEIAFYGMADGEIWISPASGGKTEHVTVRPPDAPGRDNLPTWSPDGLAIAFQSPGPLGDERYGTWIVRRDSIGGPWSTPERLTDFGGPPAYSPDGRSLVLASGGDVVGVSSTTGEQIWRFSMPDGWVKHPGQWFSYDGSAIYFYAEDENQRFGAWSVPVGGGEIALVVRFDDPHRLPVPNSRITVGPEFLHLVLDESESDIWVVDLEW